MERKNNIWKETLTVQSSSARKIVQKGRCYPDQYSPDLIYLATIFVHLEWSAPNLSIHYMFNKTEIMTDLIKLLQWSNEYDV